MNRGHLGDALDFWKRGMLGLLHDSNGRSELSRALKVVPMLTDQPAWTSTDFDTYSRLLGVGVGDVLCQQRPFAHATRMPYFNEAAKAGAVDFFLDPDVGLALKPRRTNPKHVTAAEVVKLVQDGNIVAVYCHAPRAGAGWMASYAHLLHQTPRQPAVVWYEAPQVGMLFVMEKGSARQPLLQQSLQGEVGSHVSRVGTLL